MDEEKHNVSRGSDTPHSASFLDGTVVGQILAIHAQIARRKNANEMVRKIS
ncbi:hypothetical protein KIN20_013917 [Parelaphostrongylus tenuis]|uniref:Uncharacterized protein n=1 Tax=Parelaphostrongylus tenuis TaxID=148309 RepID=A0AAD5MWR3_PARTN|nr:hypothetical protein KIN20_013917 [Parelaphostrongylus tenuis]